MRNSICWLSAKGAAVVAALLGTVAVVRPATASDPLQRGILRFDEVQRVPAISIRCK